MNRRTWITIAAVVAAIAFALIVASLLIGLWTGREEVSPDAAAQAFLTERGADLAFASLAVRGQGEPISLHANRKTDALHAGRWRPAGDTLSTVETVNTALQRLLVKKVSLHPNVAQGGALARLDSTLYVFMNRNYDNDESLMVIDLEGPDRYRAPELNVPMNLEELLVSPVMEVEEFDLGRFRVYGLHAEPAGDNAHRLFVTHSVYEPERRCISLNLSRMDLEFNSREVRQLSGWETIFTARPCIDPERDRKAVEEFGGPVSGRFPGQMAGGEMIDYDGSRLLVSVGSFHRDGESFEELVSDPDYDVGKFLLVDKQTGESSIYAEGMRNAQGLYRDVRGTIWATEHGAQGGDALNVIERDRHYGWPWETLGLNYGNRPWPYAERQGRFTRFSPPQYSWVEGIAPSSLMQIQGPRFLLWEGDLLVGSLIDQSLHRLRIGDDNRVIYHERIEMGHRIRDLETLPGGQIVMLTDDGHLVLLEDGGPNYEAPDEGVLEVKRKALERFDRLVEQRPVSAREVPEAAVIYEIKCASCHTLEPTHEVGPHLDGIYGRPVGGADGFNYSPALTDRDETWIPELMRGFLLEPGETFPGSRMPPVPLTEEEADRIVEYLRQ